jgi:iron complex outermembrane receptor protein
LGYRRSSDATEGTIDLAYIPSALTTQIFSSFVQDEITLKPGRVFLTVGTKLARNDFNSFDLEPSARLAWTPSSRHTLWAAVSRASRTPSRVDTAAYIGVAAFPGPDGLPTEVILYGHPQQKNEQVVANEVGYRAQPGTRVSIDIAAFFNTYNDLRTSEPGTPFIQADPGPVRFVVPLVFGNLMHGTTHGIEVSAEWRLTNRWTLSPGYALLRMHLHPDPTSGDTSSASNVEGSNPRHQAQLRSHLDLRNGLTWDTSVYYVGPLPAQPIASYARLDTQLSRRFGERLELSLVGQNLLGDHHQESNDVNTVVNASQVKRGAYAKITWRF